MSCQIHHRAVELLIRRGSRHLKNPLNKVDMSTTALSNNVTKFPQASDIAGAVPPKLSYIRSEIP